MKRREILQYAALSTGTAVFGPLLSSFLSGCSTPAAEAGIDYTPAAFTQDQYMLARDMMDVILPSTDTPSATDVQVDVTIDQIVDKTYAPEARETYLAGFAALAAWMSGQDYMDSSAEEKKNILGSLESSDPTVPVDALTGYLHFKQQVIDYYLTSEEIAENQLNYLPVPGEYEPCIKLSDVGGKKWAI